MSSASAAVLPDIGRIEVLAEAFGFTDDVAAALLDQRSACDTEAVQAAALVSRRVLGTDFRPDGEVALPPAPAGCPLLHAYVLLGLAGEAARRQRAQGIAPEVTAATMWDLGNQIGLHHAIHGTWGLDTAWWLGNHVNDRLFALGRLQFLRGVFAHDGAPVSRGEHHLDVHIPEGGPLDPAACDRAFAEAAEFFPRHFPDEHPGWFTCASWLLDPLLAEVLPASSNIVAFQRRFDLVAVDVGPPRVFEFVFLRPDLDADPRGVTDLPKPTTLQRALVDLYDRGGRVRQAFGVAPIA